MRLRAHGIAVWLCSVALIYAFFAGLKTVVDFDLGWQMATARYVWENHTIPSTEVFSYTAFGTNWIYPVVSGAIFFAAFKIGGYSAISWLCATVCVLTTAVICVRRSPWCCSVAVLAVPVIVEQTMPRSGLFTILLFAGFASVLFDYFEFGAAPLWTLPFMMIAWVNLHLGFIGGIALMGAYLFLESCELPFAARRDAAVARLKNAWKWLLVSAVATLANPWGWRIWKAAVPQEFPSHTAQAFAHEYAPLRAVANVLEWRDPDNAVQWLIVVAILAALAAVCRRRFGAALVLFASVGAVIEHARIAAPFASLVCLLGGSQFRGFLRTPKILQQFAIAYLTLLVVVRCVDLVNNRPYLREEQVVLFGAGPAWWLPEKATDFLSEQRLPGEVFSTFNISSYLVWKLGNTYRDFDDGRYIPFGDAVFREQRTLAGQPLDSALWREASRRRNIRTVIFPLAPLFSLGEIPLKEDCASREWKAVYMDTTAVIFVRRDSLSKWNSSNEGCALAVPQMRNDAAGYQQLENTAAIEYRSGNIDLAQALLAKAEKITAEDPALYRLKAEIAMAKGNSNEAERNFRLSLARMPTDSTCYGLGVLYMNQKRYNEALAAFQQSAALAGSERYQRFYILGKAYAVAERPKEALLALSKAEAESPFGEEQSQEAAIFRAGLKEVRAAAYLELQQQQPTK